MNNILKNVSKMSVMGLILAGALSSCGKKEQPPAGQIVYDPYAGCIVPVGTKYRSAVGAFSGGLLQIDLYYGAAGMTQIVGELQISQFDRLYPSLSPTYNSPYNAPVTNYNNQTYKTCLSSNGFVNLLEQNSAQQDLQLDLVGGGGSVNLFSTYDGSTWLTGDNIVGDITLQLQGYPEVRPILHP